jgi:penicillin-binding protein 1A
LISADHRFYEHHSIDLRRLPSALLSTLSGGAQGGGSTITQQLARSSGRAATITRRKNHCAEDQKYGVFKDSLETTPVCFLYNAFGIGMAARTWLRQVGRQ